MSEKENEDEFEICGKVHGENEWICSICGNVVDVEFLQAFHDIKKDKVADICEGCGSPEGTELLEDVLDRNNMNKTEFEERYGIKIVGPRVFNLPEELKE